MNKSPHFSFIAPVFPQSYIYRSRTSRTGWSGVHSSCNKEYLQRYMAEYFFRFNRRNHRETVLDKLIERCIKHEPVAYAQIKLIANLNG